jgi:hypothetical protein
MRPVPYGIPERTTMEERQAAAAKVLAGCHRDANGCLIWTGALVKGYGRVRWGGKAVYTHRLMYEALVGPIPEGMTIDHIDGICKSTACANVEHMEVVTQGENARRGNPRHPSHSRTHCPNGHAMEGSNIYTPPKGGRQCRQCMADRSRRWYEKKKAANV